MFQVLAGSWALLLGMLFLMVGNGLQGTLLGVRGDMVGFSTFEMSLVMSAYFAGFLGGSRLTPELIRRVGHVRVFAALASFISAVLILYPVLVHPVTWILGRVVIGFCFSGVYVTAESWLNNASSNENRGKALSLYMIVQMSGVVAAQGLLAFGDPGGYALFIVASVLISISFAPILLSIQPTPAFGASKPMTLRRLITASPLGCMGMFVLGGVYSAQFGMAAVFGAQIGLTVPQISLFVSVIYIGALVMQYPIGWMSDRLDRRILILAVAALGGVSCIFAFAIGDDFIVILIVGFMMGGTSNPLYSLLLAYTNDYLDPDDMPAASGGLLFINGVGAVGGPLVTGWMMTTAGPMGFFLFVGVLLMILTAYAAYRMTQRSEVASAEDTASYTPILPSSSVIAAEVASEVYGEAISEEETSDGATNP
ncbi:MAG: MFS transporter [Pseudomonadota bacterium]